MSFSRPWQFYGALLLAGALFPLALAPFHWWPLALPSMAALAYALNVRCPVALYKRAFAYGGGLFLAGASWVYVSIHEFGHLPAALAALATVAFCLFVALFFALPFSLFCLMPKRPLAQLVAFAALWTLSEWLRSWILTGFPWLYAGYIHTDTAMAGWAPLGGVFLLSFITALIAALIAAAAQKSLPRKTLFSIAAGLAAIAAAGHGLKTLSWTEAQADSYSAVLVQPNIHQQLKWSPGERRAILDQLAEQSAAHWGADILIWPEAAVPSIPQNVSQFLNLQQQLASESGTALLLGIPSYDGAHYYNSMLALGDGNGQYNKARLVPFGEYVPLQSLIGGLLEVFDLPLSGMSPGDDNQQPLQAKQATIATAICYEVVYPDLVAHHAAAANLLLTVSNDAWFGASIGPHQHLQMARMRALENAKPMLRGTNNGITAVMDHQGRIVDQLPQFTRGELVSEITPRNGSTPFTRYGSTPIVSLCLIICAILILNHRRTAKESSCSAST